MFVGMIEWLVLAFRDLVATNFVETTKEKTPTA
jgi:hypothetical protein